MQMYNVSVTIEVMILAEDEESAKETAIKNSREILESATYEVYDTNDWDVRPVFHKSFGSRNKPCFSLALGWKKDSLPYVSENYDGPELDIEGHFNEWLKTIETDAKGQSFMFEDNTETALAEE